MNTLKWLSERLMGNISEAKEYIDKAYMCKESDKPVADWCMAMANGHLQFNVAGLALMDKALNEFSDELLAPGVKAVYALQRAEIVKQTSHARALIDMYVK